MRYRSPARYLAPGALVVAAVVVVFVVKGAAGERTSAEPAAGKPVTTTTHHAARYYTVRSGDILSRVAERAAVSVGRLLELNPHLDPNALRPGQRLRLRP
jgi:LysM repeat protein